LKKTIACIFASSFILSGCLPSETAKTTTGSASNGSIGLPTTPSGLNGPKPPADLVESMRTGPLVHREYIQKVLSEVFMSATYNATADNLIYGFAGKPNQLARPSVFGLSCDLYSSAGYLDCGGDFASGATVPLMVEPSAVRQISKLKLCEQIVSLTDAPKAAAEKINELTAGNLNEISTTNLPKIFSLFFRNRDISPAELSAYSTFNTTLKNNSVSVTDRWRSILTELCESPEWEVL
jgi:hypothetical protein